MDQLRQSVSTEIQSGRIGDPVFLRCFYQISKSNLLEDAVATVINLADSWITSQIEYTQTQQDDCQITTLLRFADGESALLCGNQLDQESMIDFHLIGSRGTIYYQARIPLEDADVK